MKANTPILFIEINNKNLSFYASSANEQNNFQIKVNTITKDLSLQNSAAELFEELKGNSIDVLINNAGFGLFGPFYNTNWERELSMLNLHVVTTTHLTKLLLDGMIKRGKGKILNISSLAAFQSGPLMAIYYASKAYILSFS